MVQVGQAARHPKTPPRTNSFSLVRGGPFYRAQAAARLIAQNRWNLGRRLTFAIAVGWIPLVLITLVFDPRAVFGLVGDYLINARVLIGVPRVAGGPGGHGIGVPYHPVQIREAGLLTPSDTSALDETLVRLIRLRDSVIPESLIVVVACGAPYR